MELLPHYLLRNPLLPLSTLDSLRDFKSLWVFYQNYPLLQEAVFLASPGLYEALGKKGKDTLPDSKALLSLAKYTARAGYRCTPFGLFASVSLGSFKNSSFSGNLQLDDPATALQKYCRLDMDYLCALALKISGDAAIRPRLKYFGNPNIYSVGEQLRYIEYRVQNKFRQYFISSVSDSPYIQKVLEKAALPHAAYIEDLIPVLADGDISDEEAEGFIVELIDSQLLLSELEPNLNAETPYLQSIINALPDIPEANTYRSILGQVYQSLNTASNPSSYYELAESLKAMEVNFEIGQLFQVDTHQSISQNQLPANIKNELEEVIELLSSVLPYRESPDMKGFTEKFAERYEESHVSLLEALDLDMGIGYPVESVYGGDRNPLLDEVLFPAPKADAPTERSQSKWGELLLDKYIQSRINGHEEIELCKEDFIKSASPAKVALPASMYSMLSIMTSAQDGFEKNSHRIFHQITAGPSMANLLGRFCHLDTTLAEFVREAVEEEETTQPDVVFAEVVHISQARIGNIAIRPCFRKYEIPILTQAGVSADYMIHLSDLMLCMQQGKLILYSKKLQKEIIPRLSNAHNYSFNALPVYRFLCDLQYSNIRPGIGWSWAMLDEREYLPRVVYKNIILAKARWKIDTESLKNKNNEELKKIMAEKKIPAYFTLSEGDNELPINLNNDLSLSLLSAQIKSKKSLVIEECLFSPSDASLVEGKEGYYSNEFIFAWKNHVANTNVSMPFTLNKRDRKLKERFFTGGEWIYFKIYCGVKTADIILAEVVKPIVEELLADEIIKKWFFIRYSDKEGQHLRIRFQGNNDFYKIVLEKLSKGLLPYQNDSLVHKIQTDTYKPELDRYGWENIADSETLFYYDSESVVSSLTLLMEEEDENTRWLQALMGIDQLLEDFELDLPQKMELMDVIQKSFKQEFGITPAFKTSLQSLADKGRKEKKRIENWLQNDINHPDINNYRTIFDKRRLCWKKTINRIMEKHRVGSLGLHLYDLLASYIHMTVNRTLRSNHRRQEMILYDLLFQYYRSKLMKEKKNNPSKKVS